VHVEHRTLDAIELRPNERAPAHGLEVADEQQLRLEVAQQVDRFDVAKRVAMAVAADGDEVREVPEERAEDVACEQR
jgi:hypothetical protein